MSNHRIHSPETSSDDSPIWRIEREWEDIDILGWLNAQPHGVKVYWQSRDGDLEIAGVGAADLITAADFIGIKSAFDRIREQTTQSRARYFGGLCFDSVRTPRDEVWSSFGDFRFVLPLVEIVRSGSKITLALNALRSRLEEDGAEAALSELQLLRETDRIDELVAPAVGARQDYPGATAWRAIVDDSLRFMTQSKLDKVVLARRTDYPTAAPFSPWDLLKKLRDDARGRYLFGFQPDSPATFIGASPERLYRRHEHTIESEAMAGTRPTSDDPSVNRQLAEELLASEKDRREHQYVVDHLIDAFVSLCTRYEAEPQPEIVRLSKVQHLRTRLHGELRDGIDDAAILRTLHPTPAVGGTPRAEALEHLRRVEPFDRGWYAGPVGWLDSSGAEFAVAIRSALIRPDCLSLYAGAGIVTGSDADREWDELENKIAPIVRLLT
jgi:menaquinone-specific isochorismate synthase